MRKRTAVERLVAKDAIRDLAMRYAIAVDARDFDGVVELFVPDVAVGRGRVGRAALRERYEEMNADSGMSVLTVGNHVIDFDDRTHAHGFVYCHAELEHSGEWITQRILYRDRYECRDGSWLFRAREHLLFYGAAFGTSPLELPPAGKPELWTGRGSVPAIWPTFRAQQDRRADGGVDRGPS
jgi:hypothetical protein